MRNGHGCDKARRWVAQLLVVVTVVGASVIVATLIPEGSVAALSPPRVLGEPPLVRADVVGLAQSVNAERPAGQLTVAVSPVDPAGHFDVTITDSRAEDPGWSVGITLVDASGRTRSWKPTALIPTPAFSDAGGETYAQRVAAGGPAVLASAPAGHGLGIAHVHAAVVPEGQAGGNSDVAVSLTVV